MVKRNKRLRQLSHIKTERAVAAKHDNDARPHTRRELPSCSSSDDDDATEKHLRTGDNSSSHDCDTQPGDEAMPLAGAPSLALPGGRDEAVHGERAFRTRFGFI